MLELIFWILFAVLIYIYFGYPLLVRLLAALKKDSIKSDASYFPECVLIISAFNEEAVIADKLRNALELDYPADKLKIWVISDASTDKTDEIVRNFNPDRVKLFRLKERHGKTYGITALMPKLKSAVVIFSDANAMYDKNALKELTKYFVDEKIGYVVGQAKYYKKNRSNAGEHEDTYWSYEIRLKVNESLIGSVVGGDGAIYAIRRHLFEPLDPDDINDFVNPLQIILKGYRGVFNPGAICYEHTADTFVKEYKRKRRIVNRSWRGLWKNAAVLNPFKTGIHAWEIFSHKLLRWLGGLFILLFLILNMILIDKGWLYQLLFVMQIGFYMLAVMGYTLDEQGKKSSYLITIPYYFVMVNLASLLGIIDAYKGKTYTTWQTIRENNRE